jgi:aerobic carbon-monoxide dehydrogenase small subunit
VNIRLVVNGAPRVIDVPPHHTLLRALRDAAGQTDVKYGCGEGVCGACAVLLDDVAVNACLVFAVQADGARIDTAAGLDRGGDDREGLGALFAASGAVQCGFCTPGMLIGASEAVRLGLAATRSQIRHSLAGNLCRCTGYRPIIDAVEAYRDQAPTPLR